MQINSCTAERFYSIDHKSLKVVIQLEEVMTPFWRHNVFNKFATF